MIKPDRSAPAPLTPILHLLKKFSGGCMKSLLLIVAVILIPGCITAPKTPDEFKQGVKQGRGMTKQVTLDINRKFSDVFSSVRSGCDACFNISNTKVFTQGATGRIEPNSLRSYSYLVGNKNGETVITQDGNLMLVTEISGTKDSSIITIYGMSFAWDTVFSAIESWARGNRIKCPF